LQDPRLAKVKKLRSQGGANLFGSKNCPADAFLSLLRDLHNGPNAGKYLGDFVVESAASDIE
jgi:hypothetical protein